ncbi:MAG: N-acyl amino acid synthase FeeM domain-containing protein [Planctomycetota bacterium]|jgi:hypothetical protein
MSTSQQVIDHSQSTTASVTYKIAGTREERAAAFRLVYKSYLQARLGKPNRHEMRVTPYHLLPTTEVFIALQQGEVISTVSLVSDGELGLPMESVYAGEVARRREQGLRVGEVSCLADRRSHLRRFFPVFLRLSRLMVQYARRQGLDELLVAVHPKHARFYQRFMEFKVIGEETAYPAVRNHPAIALCLNFARIDRERPENYDTFFGEPLPDEQLRPRPISKAQGDHFRPVVDPSLALVPLVAGGCCARDGSGESEIGVA